MRHGDLVHGSPHEPARGLRIACRRVAAVLFALLLGVTLSLAGSALAQSGTLDTARAALNSGEAARARALAQARLAEAPGDLDAAVVAGLAAFRLGEHAEALGYFDAALSGYGDAAPIALQFDRAATLYALERLSEAEAAFAAVARAAPAALGALASLNAGYCAVDQSAPERARTYLQQARSLDRAGELGEHVAALAAELDGRPTAAEFPDSNLEAAAPATREPTEAASPAPAGLARAGAGVGAALALGGGYDSNATQAGVLKSGVISTAALTALPSAFGHASASLFAGAALTDTLFLLAQYDLEQLLYGRAELDPYAAQDHSLELAIEQRLPLGLRAGAALRGLLSFTGLRDFIRLGQGYGAELSLSAAHGQRLESALTGSFFRTDIAASEYEYLAGTRVELGLSERYRAPGGLRGYASALYRDERVGTQQFAVEPPSTFCPGVILPSAPFCAANYQLPLSYRAFRLGMELSHPLLEWLRAGARGGVEWRFHTGASALERVQPLQRATVWTRRERQRRIGIGAVLLASLPHGLGLDLSYDLTLAATNLDDDGAAPLDPPGRDFVRHQFQLSVTADF